MAKTIPFPFTMMMAVCEESKLVWKHKLTKEEYLDNWFDDMMSYSEDCEWTVEAFNVQ